MRKIKLSGITGKTVFDEFGNQIPSDFVRTVSGQSLKGLNVITESGKQLQFGSDTMDPIFTEPATEPVAESVEVDQPQEPAPFPMPQPMQPIINIDMAVFAEAMKEALVAAVQGLSPVVNVAPAEVNVRPEIKMETPPADMQPVADAISGLHGLILESIAGLQMPAPTVNIEPQQAPDISILADAMRDVAEVMRSKPDHGEAIKGLLAKVADRPQISQWSFKITRNASGDIEDVSAVAHREKGAT